MSLINQMLKDIDKRQGGVTPTLAAGATVTPPGLRSRGGKRQLSPLVFWGGVLVLTGLAMYGFRAIVVTPVVPAVQMVQVPAPMPAPAPVPVADPVTVAVTVPEPVAPPPPQEVAPEPKVKKAVEAASKAAVLPAASPLPSARAEEGAQKVGVVTESKVEGKVARVMTPEQRADNAYREAVGWVRQGRIDQARQVLRTTLADLPAHLDARLLYARILMDEGQMPQAKSVLKEGVALKTPSFQLNMALAHAQLLTHEVDEALATLEQGLPIAGENAEYHALLAAVLQQKVRHAEAVQHYVLALRQVPDAANWLVGLGVSLQALNNAQGAAEAFARAIELGLPASLSRFAQSRLEQVRR